jgi:hypothetical protein
MPTVARVKILDLHLLQCPRQPIREVLETYRSFDSDHQITLQILGGLLSLMTTVTSVRNRSPICPLMGPNPSGRLLVMHFNNPIITDNYVRYLRKGTVSAI